MATYGNVTEGSTYHRGFSGGAGLDLTSMPEAGTLTHINLILGQALTSDGWVMAALYASASGSRLANFTAYQVWSAPGSRGDEVSIPQSSYSLAASTAYHLGFYTYSGTPEYNPRMATDGVEGFTGQSDGYYTANTNTPTTADNTNSSYRSWCAYMIYTAGGAGGLGPARAVGNFRRDMGALLHLRERNIEPVSVYSDFPHPKKRWRKPRKDFVALPAFSFQPAFT